MRIGIITEGRGEILPLKNINNKLELLPKTILIDPIYANVHPKATPNQIVKAAESSIKVLLASRKVDKIIFMLDREDNDECPPDLSRELENCFHKIGYKNVCVVIKNRKFENWVISDPESLKVMKARYNLSPKNEGKISNNADQADALNILEKICIGKSYDKTKDSLQISTLINPLTMAGNSRSFRRYLRLIRHVKYHNQSKKP